MTVLSFTPGRPHAQSPGEQLLYRAHQCGALPGIWQFNEHIDGYWVDMVDRDARLIVEVDGFSIHSKHDQFRKDRQRDRQLQDNGWRVYRFTHDEVVSDLADTVATITRGRRAALVTMTATRQIEDLKDAVEKTRSDLQHAHDEAAAATHPRKRINALVLQASKCLANLSDTPADTARTWAIKLNIALRTAHGAAGERSDADHQAAWVALENWWTRFRVEHDIASTDIPDPDAPPCLVCHHYINTADICARMDDAVVCDSCLNFLAYGHPTVARLSCGGCGIQPTVSGLSQWGIDDDFIWWCPSCKPSSLRCVANCDSGLPAHYTLDGDDDVLCAQCMQQEYGDVGFTGTCALACGTSIDGIIGGGAYFTLLPPGRWTDDTTTQPDSMWICQNCLPKASGPIGLTENPVDLVNMCGE